MKCNENEYIWTREAKNQTEGFNCSGFVFFFLSCVCVPIVKHTNNI